MLRLFLKTTNTPFQISIFLIYINFCSSKYESVEVQVIELHLLFLGYQKGTFHMGIRIFNSLPIEMKALTNNVIWLKRAFNSFLYFHSFCSLQEYFDLNNHK